MLSRSILLVAAALFGFVAAQGETNTEFTIDTGRLEEPDAPLQWCAAQRQNCPNICGGPANPNECFADTLTYTCTCVNGNTPNISDYVNTLESLVCQEYKRQCIADSSSDLVEQDKCLAITCGQEDPADVKKSDGSSNSRPTGSPTSEDDDDESSPTSNTPSETPDAAVSLIKTGGNFGTPILAAAALVFFGLAL